MDLADLCAALAVGIKDALSKGGELSAREDSRAFGAMLEARIAEDWPAICGAVGAAAQPRPGARTIYDLALRHNGTLVGIDLKTRDLDRGIYSDGGICAVANLLRFLVNESGIFLLAEVAHSRAVAGRRSLEAVRVAPLHLMPVQCLRIENLGTGQVRIDATSIDPWTSVQWGRPLPSFLEQFTALATTHYRKVGEVADQRIAALEAFRASGFRDLRLK